MAPEASTVRLYHRLEEGMGKDMATVLVDHFATKGDLEALTTKVDRVAENVADLTIEMHKMELRLYRYMFTAAMVLIGTNLALYGGLVATGR